MGKTAITASHWVRTLIQLAACVGIVLVQLGYTHTAAPSGLVQQSHKCAPALQGNVKGTVGTDGALAVMNNSANRSRGIVNEYDRAHMQRGAGQANHWGDSILSRAAILWGESLRAMAGFVAIIQQPALRAAILWGEGMRV